MLIISKRYFKVFQAKKYHDSKIICYRLIKRQADYCCLLVLLDLLEQTLLAIHKKRCYVSNTVSDLQDKLFCFLLDNEKWISKYHFTKVIQMYHY